MRGQNLSISNWLGGSGQPTTRVYLDAGLWREFVDWVKPAGTTDVIRLNNLRQGQWHLSVFRDQLNRYFGRDQTRDKALEGIGIDIVNASGNGQVKTQDELYLSEATEVYFGTEAPTVARRNAEFLLLARRHSANTEVTLLTQHRSFWRIPRVNTYYLDNAPFIGNTDLPASFDFLNDFNIHSALVSVIGGRIGSPDYAHLMSDALTGLRDHMRIKSGLTAVDGYPLMEQAFGSATPPIRVNPLTDTNQRGSQQNEQRGFREISCGIMMALRNPLAHEGPASPFAQSRYPDRKTLFKYLSLLSLLCERADGPLP